jgi:hypothetical protein
MPDLEQKIIEWRRQMQVAGIPSPVPLDELENHLRDEIDRMTRSGISDDEAFRRAAEELGPVLALKTEFEKNRPWWGDGRASATDRILAMIWAVSSAYPVYMFGYIFFQGLGHVSVMTLWDVFNLLFYGFPFIGGLLLFRGSYPGRCIVRTMAMILLICCVSQILTGYGSVGWREWCGVWALISGVTVIALHRTETPDLQPWPKLKSMGIVLAVGSVVTGAELQKWTDAFISIQRHDGHGAVIFRWPVFLVLAVLGAGLFFVLKPPPGNPLRR